MGQTTLTFMSSRRAGLSVPPLRFIISRGHLDLSKREGYYTVSDFTITLPDRSGGRQIRYLANHHGNRTDGLRPQNLFFNK
jgi:hypothetical protein